MSESASVKPREPKLPQRKSKRGVIACPACGSAARRQQTRRTRLKHLLVVRLYVCRNLHQFETGEMLISPAEPYQRRKHYINTMTVRGSESKWKQLNEFRV